MAGLRGIGKLRFLNPPIIPQVSQTPNPQPEPQTAQYSYSGQGVVGASQWAGTVFTPHPSVLKNAPQLVPAFITVALQSPEQPAAQIFKQAPAPLFTLSPPPLVQGALQSPEQPPAVLFRQPLTTPPFPPLGQLWATPQLVDLTIQPTLIKVDVDALTPPALRNTWYASPQFVDLTLPAQISQTFIPPLLVMPQRPATFFSTPQLVDLSPPGYITEVSTAQISVLLKVPNRPSTFMSAPQLADFSLSPSRIYGTTPGSAGAAATNLHVYPPGLSLIGMGRTYV